MKSVLSRIDEFLQFLAHDVQPATAELSKLTDSNRNHVQRLVYTNLVDRFDVLVDQLLLELVASQAIQDDLLQNMTAAVTEATLLRYVLSIPQRGSQAAIERLCDEMRSTLLRQRHARKFERLCKSLLPDEDLKKPRVNDNDGWILSTRKANPAIPLSIVGYADWLYCRRNAVVHGGSSRQMSDRDHEYLVEHYREVKAPARSVRLKLGSITNAANFYRCISEKIQGTARHVKQEQT